MVTVSEIARRLGVPGYRVDFYLRSRNVKPVTRVANIRLFDESVVLEVAQALASRASAQRTKRGEDK